MISCSTEESRQERRAMLLVPQPYGKVNGCLSAKTIQFFLNRLKCFRTAIGMDEGMFKMMIDRLRLFKTLRPTLFNGRLRGLQVEGIEAILKGWEERFPHGHRQALAYVLATAFHETAATMQPVRETLAKTDAAAVARLDAAFAAGRLSSVRTPYWRFDGSGKTWLGRGLVQLTHKRNYQAMSKLTGVDLVADPARAMQMDVAVAILIEGMRAGSFTGRRLDHYFGAAGAAGAAKAASPDWTGARRIINGTDRAALVGAHAKLFDEALAASASSGAGLHGFGEGGDGQAA
jgi:hypothetical protein